MALEARGGERTCLQSEKDRDQRIAKPWASVISTIIPSAVSIQKLIFTIWLLYQIWQTDHKIFSLMESREMEL
jgi:hypothetical protein